MSLFPNQAAQAQPEPAPSDGPASAQGVLRRLRSTLVSGASLVATAAGNGLTARCAELGGSDLIVVYNAGRFRMAGRSSLAAMLPFGDANATLIEMAAEILPVVRDTPVVAGVCATDPFRRMDAFLDEVHALGFAGVQNFPTVGLFDGTFRLGLEETGLGFDLEVDLIRRAAARGLLAMAYVFDAAQATAMAAAGAHVLVPHMGLTSGGLTGTGTAKPLDESVRLIQTMRDAATAVNPEIIILCHGGPIASAQDVAHVLGHTSGVHGFLGASSIERTPIEAAIVDAVRSYRSISTG